VFGERRGTVKSKLIRAGLGAAFILLATTALVAQDNGNAGGRMPRFGDTHRNLETPPIPVLPRLTLPAKDLTCEARSAAVEASVLSRLDRQEQDLKRVLEALHKQQPKPVVAPSTSGGLADRVDALLEAVVRKSGA